MGLFRVRRKCIEKRGGKGNQSESKKKQRNNEADKEGVVSESYAVIKPDTVMIKASYTAVTLSTMLRAWLHMSAAYFTNQMVEVLRKRLACLFGFSFSIDSVISRI